MLLLSIVYMVCVPVVSVQVQGEIQEIVKTGLWVGDCFIYTSSVNRLNYYVGGEIVTIAHLDRWEDRDMASLDSSMFKSEKSPAVLQRQSLTCCVGFCNLNTCRLFSLQNHVLTGLHTQRWPSVPWRQGAQHCQLLSTRLRPGVPDCCNEEGFWDGWQGVTHNS